MTELDDTIRCPRCGGRDVRRSAFRGLLDSFMVALRRQPFRCRACQCRFYRSALPKTGEQPSDKPVGSGGSKAR
jgi:rubredoxin